MPRSGIKSLVAIGVCLAAAPSFTRACDYHWALGIPEPTAVWPSAASMATATAASPASALEQLVSADSVNDAAVTKWMLNKTGLKGHSTNATINAKVSLISADVTSVGYNATNVYSHATGVPSHDVGPFPGNPATPTDRNRTVRLPLAPTVNNGTKTSVGLGPVGVMVNGVAFFDPRDNQSYNNAGVWHQNANVFEASSFDTGPGHPAPDMGSMTTGNYHYHQAPIALLNQLDPGNTGQHASPLIGFAFDGFPVYGPYDYADGSGTGAVTRMTSSYALPTGVTTRANGPTVATQALGSYIEDYVYTAGSGTLDQYNGRFEFNSDYPGGTYAYHLTLNAAGTSVYPYIIGPQYYGVVDTANFGNSITLPGDLTFLPVPEPSALSLVGLGGLLLLKRRRRGNVVPH